MLFRSVLDEFHERSVEMDLVLGLLVRVRDTLRPDLRIVVMSATLDAGPVAALLGPPGGAGSPVVSAAGRLHPVEIRHLQHGDRRELADRVATAVDDALRGTDGHVLVFLPGAGEIGRCHRAIAPRLGTRDVDVLVLHGELPAAEIGRAHV